MPSRISALPDIVRRRAQNRGAEGQAWLASLDATIARLERDWRIDVGDIMHGGTEALAAHATLASGEPAVLKISPPDSGDASARAMIAANGRGYARVYEFDAAANALLMEKLGAQLHELNKPVAEQIETICATLIQTWETPHDGEGFVTGATKTRWLAEFIAEQWRAQKEPCSARVIELALDYAAQREAAFDPRQCVLAHGDAHAWNTLEAGGGAFKFVDPEGLWTERAHDLAIPMREWADDLLEGDPLALGRARCSLLSNLTGVPEEPIWQWGYIERVSSGLMLLQLDWREEGEQFLRVAEAWAS